MCNGDTLLHDEHGPQIGAEGAGPLTAVSLRASAARAAINSLPQALDPRAARLVVAPQAARLHGGAGGDGKVVGGHRVHQQPAAAERADPRRHVGRGIEALENYYLFQMAIPNGE